MLLCNRSELNFHLAITKHGLVAKLFFFGGCLRAQAATKKEKLRYKAMLCDGKVKVELGSVTEQHPFYSLSGSDNIILLTTERYHERPMVIRGPGAGAAVTAA